MKITKQKLKEIINEEIEGLKSEGVADLFKKLKGSDDKTAKDVETSLDYFTRLVNSPKELQEFMSLLPDAIKAATEDGKLGSPEAVKASVVSFIKKIAPKVSVSVAQINLEPQQEPAKPAAKPAAKPTGRGNASRATDDAMYTDMPGYKP